MAAREKPKRNSCICVGVNIGIDSGVERILEHRNDVAVADRRPVESAQGPAIRWPRKIHLIGLQGQVHLARTAQFGTGRRSDGSLPAAAGRNRGAART